MSNKYFWIEVMNGLDEKLTDSVACSLFTYQKRNDVEVSDYTVEGDKTAKKGRNGILALVACIAVMACLAVLTVVIVKNNITVQPLDSNSEYSHLTEEVQYTHSTNIYFLDKELGKEFISDPDIIKNKTIANSIKTYLFAGNFEEEFFVFGVIDNADELKKVSFDDPIGGKTGFFMDGWDIAFNPEFLSFVGGEEKIKEFCDKKYEKGTIKEKIEEITDVFMVCVPDQPAVIHFKDRGKSYFISLQTNVYWGDGLPYELFTHEEFIDRHTASERTITVNRKEKLEGYAVGDLTGACEINITKLADYIFDDEFIVRDGNKTSYYMWNMLTGEKHLFAVLDSEEETIYTSPINQSITSMNTDFWNKEQRESVFRQGELYMNYTAAYTFLNYYSIRLDTTEGLHIIFDEDQNNFTSDTDFLYKDRFRFTNLQTGPLYEEGGKAKLHVSAIFPYGQIYDGLPVNYELTLESNGVPMLVNGKESYQFTGNIKKDECEIGEDVYIDLESVTYNEYGYSTGIKMYLKYTVDASEIVSGKIESHTISQEVVVRNNPDDLTEEELIATNPVISGCKKISDNEWAFTVNVTALTEEHEDLAVGIEVFDEEGNNVMLTLPGVYEDGKYTDIINSYKLKKEDEGVVNIALRDVRSTTLSLYLTVDKNREVAFRYKEKFLLTD